MPATQIDTEATLEVRRAYPASRERVFRAWTDRQALATWFAPTAEYTVVVHDLDVRVGGSFRIEMRHSGGASHVAYGTYREIEPNSRLTFTWRWEEKPAMPETLVTVELIAQGASTELVLTHSLFVDARERDEHRQGWAGCLEHLSSVL